jgi:hypothetical protein
MNSRVFHPFELTFYENWCLIARRFVTWSLPIGDSPDF